MGFFGQFPTPLASIICSGSPFLIDLGLVTPEQYEQVELLGIMMVIRGLQPTVSMRIRAYSGSGATLFGITQDFNVNDIQDEYNATENFIGWVRFTFAPRLNLPMGGLRMQLELLNYVYDRDTKWIGVVLDWPTSMGYAVNPTLPTAAPVATEVYLRAPGQ